MGAARISCVYSRALSDFFLYFWISKPSSVNLTHLPSGILWSWLQATRWLTIKWWRFYLMSFIGSVDKQLSQGYRLCCQFANLNSTMVCVGFLLDLITLCWNLFRLASAITFLNTWDPQKRVDPSLVGEWIKTHILPYSHDVHLWRSQNVEGFQTVCIGDKWADVYSPTYNLSIGEGSI